MHVSKGLTSKPVLAMGALLGVVAALLVAGALASVNPANAPNGTHYKSGTASCSVSGTTITCSEYTLAGIGNTDATATLSATYSATVVCRNNGGNLSDSQHQGTFTEPVSSGQLEPKNGHLTVPSLTASAPTESQFLAQQMCPNPNWTPELQGSITLASYMYTLTFDGYSGPYIEITG